MEHKTFNSLIEEIDLREQEIIRKGVLIGPIESYPSLRVSDKKLFIENTNTRVNEGSAIKIRDRKCLIDVLGRDGETMAVDLITRNEGLNVRKRGYGGCVLKLGGYVGERGDNGCFYFQRCFFIKKGHPSYDDYDRKLKQVGICV
ncbi:hypothetical protein J4221_04515 [Candidatus Pacearchaeota archaeon]|nr:hypothetical protein [Candidatus Pacearchaeota archaeon]